MHLFYVDPSSVEKSRSLITLDAGDIHHVKNVLRLKVDDEIVASDQTSSVFSARIERLTSREVTARIMGERELKTPKIEFILFQSLPKSTKMDRVVQETTQLGVTAIIPFISERSVVRMDSEKAKHRMRRWGQIAKETAALSFRDRIPSIGAALTFSEMVAQVKEIGCGIAFWEEESQPLPELLTGLDAPGACALVIGPEGGFTKPEILQMTDGGIRPVSMGRYIFRTETAGVAALAMLQYHFRNLFF